jgi:signal transduction histidine kinase
MSLKFERKLPAILFAVFVAITAIGFAFYQNTVSVQEAVEMERQTQRIISVLDETQNLAVAVDTSTTNFIITNNDSYLAGFERGKRIIPQNIAEIRNLLSADPEQLSSVDRLELLTSQRLAIGEKKIEIRKQKGYETAALMISQSANLGIGENIRSTIEALKTAANAALQKKELSSDRSFSRAIWILIIGSVAGIIALTIANRLVSREIRHRKNAEDALTESNKDLEKKIDVRTAELKQLNETLLEIGGEREALLYNEKSARREAEIANRLRDEFMATVSHELRTPLNAILGWARLMKDGTLDQNQRTRAVSTIIKNSETQKRLIEDLMDITRVISGKLELEIEEIDAAELIAHAVDSIRPSAAGKHISVESRIADDVRTARINGDRNRLAQVLSNLLTNAVKFTPADGQIFLNAGTEGVEVVIDVIDNGAGISPEFLPNVFERFRQEPSSVAKNGGLGLGLAIVRSLVEMHHGTVAVESDGEGKGSKFTVRLPIAGAEVHVTQQ